MPCADSVLKKILSMIKGLGAKPPPNPRPKTSPMVGDFTFRAVCLASKVSRYLSIIMSMVLAYRADNCVRRRASRALSESGRGDT